MSRIVVVVALLAATLVGLSGGQVASAAVPAGFTDTAVISGLIAPTQAAFAADGRVFIAEKSGIIKVFDGLGDTTPTVFADLRAQVHDFWDRGLLGLALDPRFPVTPHVYVLYSYDSTGWADTCPDPPGATNRGCVIQGRLSRLVADGNTATAEQVLLTDWCQQYPSHSVGSLAFGADGALYASAGDGASFNFADWGQVGNPCADPPGARNTDLSPPSSLGGALRAQSVSRVPDQPPTLDGTIIRIDPNTGAGMPGNPFASSADANARRVIAYGLRNPFRFAPRPGTKELWVGDVGWSTFEEINRVANTSDSVAENFGWPCYEGDARQSGYDNADLTSCENLYRKGQTAPRLTYNHAGSVVANDGCPAGSSSVSGIAFEQNSNYPESYRGAMFFADAPRGCVWVMRRNAAGNPDPSMVSPFVTGANTPVQVLSGPGGDIFYVTLNGGQLRRVSHSTGNRAPGSPADLGPVPVPVIDNPDTSLRWKVGDPITFSGRAADAQDGPLPAGALRWQLLLQHCPSNCHSHTVQTFDGTANGSFNAPDHEYPSYLELVLTARDSSGRTGSTSTRIDPRTVPLTFTTSPPGRTLTFFGQEVTAPFTRTVIVGSVNSVSAPSPQVNRGVRYCSPSWSDGRAQSHIFTAPADPATYTASFRTGLQGC